MALIFFFQGFGKLLIAQALGFDLSLQSIDLIFKRIELLPGVPGAIFHIYDGELYALETEVKESLQLFYPQIIVFSLHQGGQKDRFQGIEALLKAGNILGINEGLEMFLSFFGEAAAMTPEQRNDSFKVLVCCYP